MNTLTTSKILKSGKQKEIAKLNYQISNIKNELLEIAKENKENTEKIGESLKSCGGYKKAADLIHEML